MLARGTLTMVSNFIPDWAARQRPVRPVNDSPWLPLLPAATALSADLDKWLASATIKSTTSCGVIAPHAGYRYAVHSKISSLDVNLSVPSFTLFAFVSRPSRYSGPTAAWSYQQLAQSKAKRIFVIGPSHHFFLRGCCVSSLHIAETPLGDLPIDKEGASTRQPVPRDYHAFCYRVLCGAATSSLPASPLSRPPLPPLTPSIPPPVVEKLRQTRKFASLRPDQDEQEHSLELQFPYIRHVTKGRDVSIVPILVGDVDKDTALQFGAILLPYFKDPENFFVISSDFCHWGSGFRYKPYDPSHGEIWQSITALDHDGMRLIEQLDLHAFETYLEDTENTICGRNPICVLLATVHLFNEEKKKAAAGAAAAAGGTAAGAGSAASDKSEGKDGAASAGPVAVTFVHYAQSNKVKSKSETSVSYAAAVVHAASEQIKSATLPAAGKAGEGNKHAGAGAAAAGKGGK